MSIVAFAAAASTKSSRSLPSIASSFCLAVVSFNLARKASKVSTSLSISEAKSSFNSGSSLALISLTVTLNTAGLPANSAAWYSSGKVTSTSVSSPALAPINFSSKPGMNEPEPISRA